MSPSLRQLSARKAVLSRHFGADDSRTLEAASELRFALLEKAIRDAVTAQPPLDDDGRRELAALLLGGDHATR